MKGIVVKMDKSNFKSLRDLMDDELQKMKIPKGFRSLELFIEDGKKSAAFIRSILNEEDFDIPDESNDLYEVAELRARHSAVTFLIGLVFKHFAGLFDDIPSIVEREKDFAMQMWLMTSLYHDQAYSSEFIKKIHLDLEKRFIPFLLTDEYTDKDLGVLSEFSSKYQNSLAYTYETILNYDEYAIHYHESNNFKERRDHGILGGVMMFKKLTNKAIKKGQNNYLPVIKACSLAVAQHNIFKAEEKDDDTYRSFNLDILLSDSLFKITKEKSLLIFLSLVDTVECVKKFSKNQNNNKYLETLTVLNSVKISVEEQEILIDLSDLSKRIKRKQEVELNEALNSYRGNIENLTKWTEFNVSSENDVFSIKINNK